MLKVHNSQAGLAKVDLLLTLNNMLPRLKDL
jgi:hypothetical protein